MRTTIMMSVKPILLGGSATAIRTATALFLRYSLSSCAFVSQATLLYRLLPFVLCRILSNTDDCFVTMALDHFTREYGESTYILIPCTDAYRRFVERNRDTLEKRFIIRYPEELFVRGELFPLTVKGKDV